MSREAPDLPRFLYLRGLWAGEMRPVDRFAAFCETLTQSEDRWEGLEPW